MKKMKCKLCGTGKVTTIYDGPIREAGPGSEYEGGYTALECLSCGAAFLDPFPPDTGEKYETGNYWVKRTGDAGIDVLQAKYDPEQFLWLSRIGIETFRNKITADFGCGAGLFLDMVHGVAARTIGIEPAAHLSKHLASKHTFFPKIESIEDASVDVAVTFDTLEHLPDPVYYLNQLSRILKRAGRLIAGVPNKDDFLVKLVPAYHPFFYHKNHLFYFNARCLSVQLQGAGFTRIDTGYVHKYDLMNMVTWAKDGKGIGTKGSALFDETTEDSFRKNLERQGIASHILLKAVKQ